MKFIPWSYTLITSKTRQGYWSVKELCFFELKWKNSILNNKFIPTQAQFKSKLANINLSLFKGYKPGYYLLINAVYKEINYKRERSFNELAFFRVCRCSNDFVELCTPYGNNRNKHSLFVLLM
jgi:hypothetical protein